MTMNSGQNDLNADVGMLDRENDVVGHNPLESNDSIGLSDAQTLTAEPTNDKVWDQMVSPVVDNRGDKGLMEPLSDLVVGEVEKNMGCEVMINAGGKEGFDRESEFVCEVNDMEGRSQLDDGDSDVKAHCFSTGLTKDEENKSMTESWEEDQVVCEDIDKEDLVVDIGSIRNLQDTDMNQKSVSSQLNFCVSDLVWGKVRGYPWWPGQILDPSAASAMVKKHCKKDSYLITYHGENQTFSWNNASNIKPFLAHFSELEKQALKQRESDHFHQSVNRALDEVSRRVEFGLSCPCKPEGVSSDIQTQTVTNAGVQKQSNTRDGGDRFLNATSFEPAKLINFVKSLAQSPLREPNRLDFAIAQAGLLAFSRSKGYSKLPEFTGHDGLCENDLEILLEEREQHGDQIDGKVLETALGFSNKSKNISVDSMRPRKKQKKMSELMSEEKGKHVLERKARNKSISSSWGKNRKAAEDVSDSSQNKKLKSDSISPNEMLSQLRLAAIDPTRENVVSSDMESLFVKFRNSVSLDNCAASSKKEMSYLDDVSLDNCAASSKKEMSYLDESSKEDISPTALILKFNSLDSVPSETELNHIFERFGPLIESETKLLKEGNRAKVVFKRSEDARAAFSSPGKYCIFGHSLCSYSLKELSSTSNKSSVGARKLGGESSTSVEGTET